MTILTGKHTSRNVSLGPRPRRAILLSLTVICMLGSGTAASLFRVAQSSLVGAFPVAMAAGDFNGDSKVDVAVVSDIPPNSGLFVLIGNGDGTFQSPVRYTTGLKPVAVTLGDFNSDGKLDLAVADGGSENVNIFLGNGDGTFQSALKSNTGIVPVAVIAGDFNKDGKLDLATANQHDNDVSILLGNGDGSFQLAVSYSVGTSPSSVTEGDFNRDGNLDLAATNHDSNNVSILLGNGDGSFQAAVNYSTGTGPASVATGDFNQDGKLDLLIANQAENTVSLLRGNGDGTFRPTVKLQTGGKKNPQSIAVGDFNNDGKQDFAVANYTGEGTVSVLLGSGNGSFNTAVNYLPAGIGPVAVAVGDANGDHKLDLITTDEKSQTLSVMLGFGDGTFAAETNYLTPGVSVAMASGDFNLDGNPDLVVTNQNSQNVSVLLGKNDGTFKNAANYPAGVGPYFVTVADFNRDGKPDLAVSDFGRGNKGHTVGILLGNGDGTFQAPVPYQTDVFPRYTAVADFNGDGNLDLAITANQGLSTGDFVDILLGNGDGTFQPRMKYLGGRYLGGVAAGDFEGDGKVDLAVVDTEITSQSVDILRGNGDGTFQAPVPYRFDGQAYGPIVVADFNHDGKLDLAVTVQDTLLSFPDYVAVLLGNGDGTFQEPSSRYPTGGVNASDLVFGDFNGDGNLDFAVPTTQTKTVSILLGNGDGTFQAPSDYSAGFSPFGLAVGDFNHDGLPDIGFTQYLGQVNIMLNTGGK